MKPRLERFSCPTCGALLGEDPTGGAVRCEYCGRRSTLLDGTLAAGRSMFVPTIDRSEATLALRRALLEHGVLPGSLRSEIRPAETRLVFVPFHAARGIRAGVAERVAEGRTSFESHVTDQGARQVVVRRREPEPGGDRARVVLGDVERSRPAVRRPGWGLESLSPGSLLARGAHLHPYDPDEVRRLEGTVLAADADPAEALGRLEGEAGRGEMRLVSPSVRTILVPVWRLRYRVRGTLHDATIDAVEGTLVAARGPENDRRRIPIGLAYLGTASLLAGLLARTLFGGGTLGFELLLVAWVLMLVLLALFSTYAWNVVRYDAERVYADGRVWSEYLNKPPTTRLEAFWQGLFEKVGEGMDPTQGKGR